MFEVLWYFVRCGTLERRAHGHWPAYFSLRNRQRRGRRRWSSGVAALVMFWWWLVFCVSVCDCMPFVYVCASEHARECNAKTWSWNVCLWPINFYDCIHLCAVCVYCVCSWRTVWCMVYIMVYKRYRNRNESARVTVHLILTHTMTPTKRRRCDSYHSFSILFSFSLPSMRRFAATSTAGHFAQKHRFAEDRSATQVPGAGYKLFHWFSWTIAEHLQGASIVPANRAADWWVLYDFL